MKESKTCEFKQDISRTFLRTVSAYANFESGEIMFGVADDGTAVGVDDPIETSLAIENSINDNIKPMPRYTLETRTIDGKQVVVLRVFEGKDKPYYYHGKAYRRSDTADIEVDRLELNRLVLEGQNLSFEEVRSHQQDLSFAALARELQDRCDISPTDLRTLKTLNLFSAAEGYNNAAAVLADINAFAGLDMVRFGADETEILDRERHIGISALDQLEAAVAMYRTYYQYEKIQEMVREKRSLVPEEAFREAIANALVHRQWDSSAHLQIGFYQQSIRIVSPGGLPAGISFSEYLQGRVSILRNPIIGNVFFRLKYIEMFGTGIRRIRDAYDGVPEEPVFEATDNFLSVELPVIGSRNGSLTDEERMVTDLFAGGRMLTRREVEERTGLGKAKAGRVLNSLIDKGRLFKKGNGRAVRYSSLK